MKTMLFKKTIIAALIAALVLAALPLTGVFAAGQTDPTPPAQGQGLKPERLEKIWARMNRFHERLGKLFEEPNRLVEKAERMIAWLEGQGKPTAEVEAALEAFQDALKDAHPIYESCKGILNSHKGFDSNGKVTDAEQAKETIRELGAKFGEIHSALDGTGKALIELMKSIREAHPPAPTSGG